jgi:SAM-dependent methyltransferase
LAEPDIVPWDIGRPQPAVLREIARGGLIGRVLDAGCGAGDNAVALAQSGRHVTGIDLDASAIAIARGRARSARAFVEWHVQDALRWPAAAGRFDSVLASSLLDVLEPREFAPFAHSCRRLLRPEGRAWVLCFSEADARADLPGVTREALVEAFATGWTLESLEESRYDDRVHADGARAWWACFRVAPRRSRP